MADIGHEAQRVTTSHSVNDETGEYGFPQGHLGHLTSEQDSALQKFKSILVDNQLLTPATEKEPASHDDVTLLRFLRARRFVPNDALGQFKDTEAWRKRNHIKDLYDNIDVTNYEETRHLYPQWTGRRDKRGIPVYVFEVAPLNSKTMSAYNKSSEKTAVLNVPQNKKDGADVPPRLMRLFALYENLTEFALPLCTKLTDRPSPETPISQSNNIVDISKVGLKQFWNLRSHMQDASTLATAHYPETLDRIFIVGAPSFFPTVWGWIKRWFDPITTSKIFILSDSIAFNTLSSFIEPENIPKKYGGKLDWNWGDSPKLDVEESEHLKFNQGVQGWPQGPLRWVPKTNDEWELLAVGSISGKERREAIGTLKFDSVNSTGAAAPITNATSNTETAPAAAVAASTAPEPFTNSTEHAAAISAIQASVATPVTGADLTTPANPPALTSESEAPSAGIAALSVANGESKEKTVTESAPIPPQPMITPEVPLSATATDLPAATPGEELQKKDLLNGGA